MVLVVTSSLIAAQNEKQMADFEITHGVEYSVTKSLNILANITGKTMTSMVKRTQQCSQYSLCETATYYAQTRSCLLT